MQENTPAGKWFLWRCGLFIPPYRGLFGVTSVSKGKSLPASVSEQRANPISELQKGWTLVPRKLSALICTSIKASLYNVTLGVSLYTYITQSMYE